MLARPNSALSLLIRGFNLITSPDSRRNQRLFASAVSLTFRAAAKGSVHASRQRKCFPTGPEPHKGANILLRPPFAGSGPFHKCARRAQSHRICEDTEPERRRPLLPYSHPAPGLESWDELHRQ